MPAAIGMEDYNFRGLLKYLLLAVSLLAVSSLRAVTLLGRGSLVVARRCRLG